MNYTKLMAIDKLYFGYEEISKTLGIGLTSARVCATRYVKNGFLIRLKRNLYILKGRWGALTKEEKFTLANLLQVPSYVSLTTALDYYEITTQIQRDFIESIDIKRTKEVEIEKNTFAFTKIDKKLYFGFTRQKDFFIAEPEKAFLDALYLMSLRRYTIDMSAIDFGKFNASRMGAMARKFPIKIQKLVGKYGYLKKT